MQIVIVIVYLSLAELRFQNGLDFEPNTYVSTDKASLRISLAAWDTFPPLSLTPSSYMSDMRTYCPPPKRRINIHDFFPLSLYTCARSCPRRPCISSNPSEL